MKSLLGILLLFSSLNAFGDVDRKDQYGLINLTQDCTTETEGKACARDGKLGYCKSFPATAGATGADICIIPVLNNSCTKSDAERNAPCVLSDMEALGICNEFKWQGRDYNCVAIP
jgi:hypothetical protein